MTNELTWFRSHVEQLLREVWEVPEVVRDADGDYPTRVGGAPVWVRLEPGHPMSVWVYAHAVVDVKRSATLLAELNRLSAASRFCAVHWVAGCVVVEYSLPSAVVTADVLAGIVGVVGSRADDLGPLLVPMFGGSLPFETGPVGAPAAGPDAA